MGQCYIVRRGGAGKSVPILKAEYPADLEVWGDGGSATFKVEIEKAGRPSACTYQWYRNGTLASWATGPTCTFYNLSQVATLSVYCVVTNAAGSVISRTATLKVKSPTMTYTYTGESERIDDGDGNWRVKLKSSGVFTITELGKDWDGALDIFVVGGGGGGSSGLSVPIHSSPSSNLGGGGGGGGYTLTEHAAYVLAGRGYAVTIGSGGAANAGSADPSKSVAGDGGYSRFADLAKASGGKGASKNGGDGGSGGGGAAYTTTEQSPRVGRGGNGGTNGGNGNAGVDGVSNGTAGNGQGTTTREFGETTGTLYSGGGAGSAYNVDDSHGKGGAGGGGNGGDVSGNSSAGEANTGGGGGGGIWNNYGSSGGSGVVVIRNTRNQPVVITQQPQDVSAAENANAVFTVAASGTGLTYKWQFQATDDPYAWADTSAAGYNTDTLTVQALAYRNGYKYRCIITNADGVKTTSLPAALAIAGV